MAHILVISLPGSVCKHFAREAASDRLENRELPADMPCLEAGQRVKFNVHAGKDGPCYATEVELIADAPTKQR